ncbi:MAG: copper transporter [Micrococcales bacterium]|nr:copper transporter [Micrococcales bacterium]
MIDFRYHLVSLISVFLALAVGIALGAGPLKETIGESLTGQVERLRGEKEALRSDVDAARRALNNEQAFIDQSAGPLLAGRLTDRRVVVIELGPIPDETVAAVVARLTQADALVTGHVRLTDTWTDQAQRPYRTALSGSLTPYLDTVPQGVSTEGVLAMSIVQGLVGADEADPTRLSDSASMLLDLLASGDHPLVVMDEQIIEAADAIVVIAPPLPAASKTKPTPPSDAVQAARLAVVTAAASGSAGAVLVDGSRGEGALVDALLNDVTLRDTVTTVSGVSAVSAQVTVPMALAAQIAGTVGHYGFGESETVLPPTLVGVAG